MNSSRPSLLISGMATLVLLASASGASAMFDYRGYSFGRYVVSPTVTGRVECRSLLGEVTFESDRVSRVDTYDDDPSVWVVSYFEPSAERFGTYETSLSEPEYCTRHGLPRSGSILR